MAEVGLQDLYFHAFASACFPETDNSPIADDDDGRTASRLLSRFRSASPLSRAGLQRLLTTSAFSVHRSCTERRCRLRRHGFPMARGRRRGRLQSGHGLGGKIEELPSSRCSKTWRREGCSGRAEERSSPCRLQTLAGKTNSQEPGFSRRKDLTSSVSVLSRFKVCVSDICCRFCRTGRARHRIPSSLRLKRDAPD